MNPGELALPLISFSAQESRPCTSPGQHRSAGPGQGGARESALRTEEERADLATVVGAWREGGALPAVTRRADPGVIRVGELVLSPHWL